LSTEVQDRSVAVPTGTPIRDIREQLLAAAERVLLRDGADAVTSRAVTTEAGVAKGVLHRHFPDFGTFLATVVLAQMERLDALAADLRASAGRETPVDNLARSLSTALDARAIAIVSLIASRQELLTRLRVSTPTGFPLLAETTRMVGAYLTAERGLGRVPPDTDVDTLAVILVGTAHLLATDPQAPNLEPGDLRGVMSLIVETVGLQQPERAPQT
jgi:AcrR family transcriptional regulator